MGEIKYVFPLADMETYFDVEENYFEGTFKVFRAHVKRPDFFDGRFAASPEGIKIPDYVAVKQLFVRPGTELTEEYQRERIFEEARILCEIENDSICKGFALFFDEEINKYCLVMEYLAGGTLVDCIKGFKIFTEYDVCKIISELALGLKFCHDKPLFHRDIKPANIMLREKPPKEQDRPSKSLFRRLVSMSKPSKKMQFFSTLADAQKRYKIVLADFGTAKLKPRDDHRVGTLQYMAPEIVQAEGKADYGKADLWSLGCVAFYLLSGGTPFIPLDQARATIIAYRVGENAASSRPEIQHTTPQAREMLDALLDENPKRRLSAQELLSQAWFTVLPSIKKGFEIPRRNFLDQAMPDRAIGEEDDVLEAGNLPPPQADVHDIAVVTTVNHV